MIVDVTISRRSFVFGQSRARVSAGFTNVWQSQCLILSARILTLVKPAEISSSYWESD